MALASSPSLLLPSQLGTMIRLRRYSSIADQLQQFLSEMIVSNRNESKVRTNSLLGPSKKFPLPGEVRCNVSVRVTPSSSRNPLSEHQKVDQSRGYAEAGAQRMVAGGFWPGDSCVTMSLKRLNRLVLSNGRASDYKATQATQDYVDRSECAHGMELGVQACPWILKKELQRLFPDVDLGDRNITVLSLTRRPEERRTLQDWEKEEQCSKFIQLACSICERLQAMGYFAEFLHPHTGRPYRALFGAAKGAPPVDNSGQKYEQVGFRISKIGECSVVENVLWASEHAFLGNIFTDLPIDSVVLKDVIASTSNSSGKCK